MCSVGPLTEGRKRGKLAHGILQTLPGVFSYDLTIDPHCVAIVTLTYMTPSLVSPSSGSLNM